MDFTHLIKLVKLWAKGSKLPGPPCPSFYGHSRLFSSENITDFLSKSHEKYGSIVRLWLGPTQLLVSIKDPAVIKEMLVKAEDKLPSTGRAFRLAFGRSSLFASSFEKVQKRRESLAVQMNGKLLERANAIPSKVVDCVMERIDSIMAKGVVDCRSFSQHTAFSMLGSTLFGDAFLAWSNAAVYEELLMKIAKEACYWASYSIPPFWKRGFWRYKCLCTRLRCLTQDIIQQCRQNHKFSQLNQNSCNGATKIGRETATDAVFSSGGVMEDDLFLAELDGRLNKNEPCGNTMGVMFHGCLTTAGLIGNILTRLVMHPEIQDKIYSEIMMVRKRSTKSEVQNIYEMNFLLATVYESARHLPAGPLLQRCSQGQDLNLKTGITVPAGSILVVPIQLVQMDGSSWGNDASEFNPHRFLSKADGGSYLEQMVPIAGATREVVDCTDGPLVLNDPNVNDSFLPFGSGKRACIGQKFAILGIATLFASLVQHYEIRLQPGSEDDPKPTMNNCVLQLLPSPKIVFVKRNC
ncbi:Cytochrome P450 [Macleaya cordata]|uniref:Cytochrome P450 n=1 Tax=Macleaya cordata TaxID=56857 RepID=A0A200RDA2_MACCD|nr:Cytochrome P450 [Macleaya cordata]